MAKELNVSIKILPGEVEIEGDKLNISDAEIVIDENKNMSVVVKEGEVKIKNKEIEVKVKGDIEVDPEAGLSIKGMPINLEPIKVRERIKDVDLIKDMTLEIENNKPVYVVVGEDEGKLLGVIPMKIKMHLKIDAVNGEVVEEEKPWWSIFVFG